MTALELLAIAVALAMDAFAVAIATGVQLKCVDSRQTFRLAWHFGLFQALMPIIGWSLGLTVRSFIESYAHWIAFALLAWIGIRMLKEAFETDTEEAERCDPTKGMSLIMLSVATSIDALAVGLSMSVLGISIWYPAIIIGLVALAFTAAGLHIGRLIGGAARFGQLAEILGGSVLLLIGVKILAEHNVFAFLMG
ncbi:manganese efflux pump MntP family protein [Desulfovibrio mangrovi]|uniref:manganese efflux pump MntP n=1 Tax=Desulfovibrio mangrovi TaxID=2976983 RepID=UPI0022471570|nr:manganese efflux pump MntP family protein [Desulfovibrio mangrovi]UZP67129.1 manganese efflux pump MntP family protein [Desulfovibrio mangrovi]